MEALLKLIVGVDGVTAEMLVQIAHLYVLVQAISVVATTITILGLVGIICYTVRWGINRNCEVVEKRNTQKDSYSR